jgi:glycosyltransferase involved in cell wall biosynthesis
MRIGLVKIGEPLPGEGLRTRRMTRLASLLAREGHEVTWWTSDWSHQGKARRPAALAASARSLGFDVRMLPAPGYRSNVSVARIAHHRTFARALIAALDEAPKPDLLWVCFPAIPHTLALAKWAPAHGVKLIYDIRDLSPDVFTLLAPRPFRGIAQTLLSPLSRSVGRAFSVADGLAAVSDGYLKWAEGLALGGGKLPAQRSVFALGYEPPEVSPQQAAEAIAGPLAEGLAYNGRLKAVFAGTFGSSYDLSTIIAAARMADAQSIPVDFVLAGGGDAAPAVTAAATEIERLTYLGWLEADTLQILLSRADFGLMAYAQGATQGLPNKLYEYMANGLVIVNSLAGETAALIEQAGNGVSYPAGAPEALLAAVKRIAADGEQRGAMSAASRRAFEAGFDRAAEGKRMLDFIATVAR